MWRGVTLYPNGESSGISAPFPSQDIALSYFMDLLQPKEKTA